MTTKKPNPNFKYDEFEIEYDEYWEIKLKENQCQYTLHHSGLKTEHYASLQSQQWQNHNTTHVSVVL